MKETFYFSHDYNARSDEKIVKLISKEGWEGYGLFWAMIEKLYEADGWIDEDYDCIAFDLRTESERITRIINNYNLFNVASKKISSNSVLARLRLRKGKSEQARQSANLRWNKPNKSDANALRTQSEGNAIKESKVKNSKGKENKELTSTSEQSSQVNKMIDIFYKVNPTINYGNKTMRKSVENLYKIFGTEKALRMAEYACSILGTPYAPTISTPQELETKATALAAFYQKSQSQNGVANFTV